MNSQQLQERIDSLENEVSEMIDSDLSDRTSVLYDWLYDGTVYKQTVSDILQLLALQTDLINALLQQSELPPKPLPDNGFVPMSSPSYHRKNEQF